MTIADPAPLRVGIVVNNLNVGGLEKVALNLIRGLQRAGHDPHLICLDGAGRMFGELEISPQKVLICRKRVTRIAGFSFDFSLVRAIRRFAVERRLQVLHAHNLAPLVYSGVASRLVRPRPRVIYSEHNQMYSASPAVRRRFRHYLKLADEVIAVSHDLRRELVDVIQTTRPVLVVHNGIDAPSVAAEARASARALFGGNEDFVFGMVAVLSKQKGVEYLLQAAHEVLAELPNARFVVVGDGPLKDDLIRRRDELGLSERVIFTGYRSDVPSMMAGFDVYVQPSLWEGLPIVLLEALAAGKPIVATAVGGNREAVEHEVNGLIVPPADAGALAAALLRMARDPGFRAEVALRNRGRFAAQFASAAMLEKHLDIYFRVVKGTR